MEDYGMTVNIEQIKYCFDCIVEAMSRIPAQALLNMDETGHQE
jgi:hypothetical protein